MSVEDIALICCLAATITPLSVIMAAIAFESVMSAFYKMRQGYWR